MLAVKAAAQFLGVPESALRRLVDNGDMKHVRVGQRIYVTRDQINEFLEANTHTGYTGRWAVSDRVSCRDHMLELEGAVTRTFRL